MSDRYRVCLLGFAPESEERIKIIIQHEQETSVQFVPANHQGLNAVIVNAVFLDAPQIKKFLGQTSATVVCATNNTDAIKDAQNQGYMVLDLYQPNPINQAQWLGRLFGKAVKTTTLTQDAPISRPAPRANNQNAFELIQQLEKNSHDVLLLTHQNDLTWVKLKEGICFINYSRENIVGIDRWTLSKSHERDIPDSARALKLDLWLFESIWQSHLEVGNEINEESFYRLSRWPQPLGREGRTEALRLAASTQSAPVNLATLREKTNYPLPMIKRFLFAALKANQLTVSKSGGAVQSASTDSRAEEKRSLLSRLREKLGIGV